MKGRTSPFTISYKICTGEYVERESFLMDFVIEKNEPDNLIKNNLLVPPSTTAKDNNGGITWQNE